MKRLVFIYNKKGIDRLIRYSNKEDCSIVSLAPEIDFILKQKGVKFKSISDFRIKQKPYKKVFIERVKLFNQWGMVRTKKGTIKQRLTSHGISLWDVLENEAGEVNLEIILIFADIIQKIISKEQPSIIVSNNIKNRYFVPRDKIFFPELLRSISKKNKIRCKLLQTPSVMNVAFQSFINASLCALTILRRRQRKVLSKYHLRKDKKSVLFFLYGKGMDKTNPVQKELMKRRINSIAICSGGLLSNSCAVKLNKERLMYAYHESFIDKEKWSEIKQRKKDVFALWKELKKKKNIFIYKGIDLFPVFAHQFRHLLKTRIPEILILVTALGNIFKETDPGMIVTVNDAVFYGKTAVLFARKNKVPSLLIQHAKSLDTPTRLNPLSDYIASWTPLDRKQIGRKVDLKRFIFVGSLKQESLKKEARKHSRKDILAELGLPSNKRIILFAARYPITRDVFRIKALEKMLKGKKNILAIIKIHPADTQLSLSKLSKMYSTENLIFLRTCDFAKLLSIADIVLSTEECTTCSDAIMVKKPLITINFEETFDQPFTDIPDYGRNPPFLRADSSDKLNRHIKTLLYDKQNISKLARKMEQYNVKYSKHGQKSEEVLAMLIQNIIKK